MSEGGFCENNTLSSAINIPYDLYKGRIDNKESINVDIGLNTDTKIPSMCYNLRNMGGGGDLVMPIDLERALNIWNANHLPPVKPCLPCQPCRKLDVAWIIGIIIIMVVVVFLIVQMLKK